MSDSMRYVSHGQGGGREVLQIATAQRPAPQRGEVVIAVEASGLSHADVMQRQGRYPPPPGASPVLGLEVAGTVAAVGTDTGEWQIGDRVCALTNGGGYAEFVAVPHGQILPIPSGWSAIEAATLPENAFTVYDNVFTRGRLVRGETVLVHGGTSGIGTTAIMFAKAAGATVFATAGSAEKCAACVRLGATAAIEYRTHDFVTEVQSLTDGNGVDVVVDIVGGEYLARDLAALAIEGRIACIAHVSEPVVRIDLRMLYRKRATIFGSSLRPRSAHQKAAIATLLRERIWPLLPARDPIRPVVDSVFPFERAADAHERLESSAHIGKIVLVPRNG